MSASSRLAAVFGEAATALAIRDSPWDVSERFLALIEEPAAFYESHPCWPSLLTSGGFPVELSLKLGRAGAPALRCTVDVTDHRTDLSANWTRWLEAGAQVAEGTGTEVTEIWDLLRVHLDGIPPAFPSKVMHGLAYAAPDWYRGSLYFRTGWLGSDRLASRLPALFAALAEVGTRYHCPLPNSVEVVGYDLVSGEPLRSKAYTWAAPGPDGDFAAAVGTSPDLTPAREVYEAFRQHPEPAPHPRSLLLQTSVGDGSIGQRLFFFASAWGWTTDAEAGRLLDVMARKLGVDTEPLPLLVDVAARHGVALQLALVAVGGEDGAPSATFYLWPTLGAAERANRTTKLAMPAAEGPEEPARASREMIDRAAGYLLQARGADGLWEDYDDDSSRGGTATFVTACVAAALSGDPHYRDEIRPTCDWLASSYRSRAGAGSSDGAGRDPETSALVLQALANTDRAARDAWQAAVDGAAEPEVISVVLSALLHLDAAIGPAVSAAAAALVDAQRPDGAWDTARWSTRLLATHRAVSALAAYVSPATAAPPDERAARTVARALSRARLFLSSVAIGPEASALALWLGCIADAQGPLNDPRVSRALGAVARLQQPDGRWLGAPLRRVTAGPATAGAPFSVDPRCIVTTATVVSGLQSVATKNPVVNRV